MRVDKISISLPLFLSLLLVYLEAIFHIYEFRTLTGEIFFTVLFSAMGGESFLVRLRDSRLIFWMNRKEYHAYPDGNYCSCRIQIAVTG